MALLAFIIVRPAGDGEVAGQAVGVGNETVGKEASEAEAQAQAAAYREALQPGFDEIGDEIDALLNGHNIEGDQLSTAAHPCSYEALQDATTFRECCGALAGFGCHVYCSNQKEHSYDLCMNGFTFWPFVDEPGCLEQMGDLCDELYGELTAAK